MTKNGKIRVNLKKTAIIHKEAVARCCLTLTHTVGLIHKRATKLFCAQSKNTHISEGGSMISVDNVPCCMEGQPGLDIIYIHYYIY